MCTVTGGGTVRIMASVALAFELSADYELVLRNTVYFSLMVLPRSDRAFFQSC